MVLFLVLIISIHNKSVMTELRVNVAQKVFFLTLAGATFWVKAVTTVLKHLRNSELEGEKKILVLALNLLK